MSSKLLFDKSALIILCKIAQQTQRYQDMISFVDQIYKLQQQLTTQERNLCATAYKNLIGIKRAQLKTLKAIEDKEEEASSHNKILFNHCLRDTKQSIKDEFRQCCKRILSIVDEFLIPKVKSVEDKIFYLKMKGDYNRYLCEFFEGDQSSRCLEFARHSYEQADSLARSNLASTNPVRLGLHLNMSVFCYEILGKRQKALELANRTFEDSISNIDNVNEIDYKDCTFIMQLLRDNITLWSSEEDS